MHSSGDLNLKFWLPLESQRTGVIDPQNSERRGPGPRYLDLKGPGPEAFCVRRACVEHERNIQPMTDPGVLHNFLWGDKLPFSFFRSFVRRPSFPHGLYMNFSAVIENYNMFSSMGFSLYV